MYLDLYCENCSIAVCATCELLDHKDHTCVNINTKKDQLRSQLDQVLAQTEVYLKSIKAIIDTTDQESIKMKAEVDGLKKQTSASYGAIIQKVKRQHQEHLAAIENAGKSADSITSEGIEKHHKAEAAIKSIQLYGNHLKKKGTIHNMMTNVKGLIDRCEKFGEECSKLKTMKCEVKVDWSEYSVDVKRVILMGGGGMNAANDNKIKYFQTQLESQDISGISVFQNHLIVVHNYNYFIQIYDDNVLLKETVHVSGMNRPSSLCLVHVDGDKDYLLVTSLQSNCVWWVNVEAKVGQVKLGLPQKHNLGYEARQVAADIRGHALVCDTSTSRVYVYSHPVQPGTYIQLPNDVKPVLAVSDPAGGYVIIDMMSGLVWVTSAGQVTRRYTDKPAVSPRDMAFYGADLLVVDSAKNCVHVVDGEGKHAGHLVTGKQGVRTPTCISVDIDHQCVWLGHSGQRGNREVMRIEYTPVHNNALTLCATLPKTHL